MTSLLIYYIHTVAAVWLFTKRWQEGDWKEGLLAVAFLVLIFCVGWSMSTFILKLFVEEKGIIFRAAQAGSATNVGIDRDGLSLLLLLIMEAVFFLMQTRRRSQRRGESIER